MAIVLGNPGVDGLSEAVGVLQEWQYDGAPMQLHPGDLGWFWRFGAEATAAAVRTWSRDGQILAVGLLDGPTLLRLTIAPAAQRDEGLADQLVADVSRPERGVLPAGKVSVEAPMGALVQDLLFEDGWKAGESWTPLCHDLTKPVKAPGVRIEVVGPGKPGLLEPMGVHREHRGQGHGKAITIAASAALQGLGSSSAIVCTPSFNVGAVATYQSAGFQQLPERRDRYRDA